MRHHLYAEVCLFVVIFLILTMFSHEFMFANIPVVGAAAVVVVVVVVVIVNVVP